MAYHWRDQIYFGRAHDGSVMVWKNNGEGKADAFQLLIPQNEWASIVCSVSTAGETGERWNAAQDFHGRSLAP
jgi:hypothetical protein